MSAAFIVLVAFEAIILPFFPVGKFVHHHYVHSSTGPIPLGRWILDLIQATVSSIIIAPCMLASHRFVLAGEHNRVFKNFPRVGYFAFWITLVHLLPAVMTFMMDRVAGAALLGLVIYYVMARLVMSFPAIALDISSPIRDGWSRTKGHWWEVVSVMVFGLAPFVLLAMPFALGFGFLGRVFAGSLFGLLMPVIGAALASELYRKFGGEIPEPSYGSVGT